MLDPDNKYYKPDWAPSENSESFAVRIMKAEEKKEPSESHASFVKKEYSVDDYVQGILSNNRTILAKAITLIESNSKKHFDISQQVLNKILPHSGKSIRIGISGVPGAGKSTFIENFGLFLINKGFKVAVLTVDPSSSITKGSILGDKTRMEKLSREQNCFIRPSPSGGALGGVTRKTRETILACEAAGYDVVIVETVGVGQNEIAVRSMVDFYLLILVAGAGDELQGIKKGVIEIVDAIMINKADSGNELKANAAKSEYESALRYQQPFTKGWKPKVITGSALFGKGIEDIWNLINDFINITKSNNFFEERRSAQRIEWMLSLTEDLLKIKFYADEEVKKSIQSFKVEILNNSISPSLAAESLIKVFFKSVSKTLS